ncbi:MAG: 2-C-methyl-D-erythritol 4-phosphate cytidylyltransferase [Verrucomicrobiota bacterium]|nr:2-C-methyl-D-erythritol 4-phosphate cytidylyltransferase [Limisphaera sp.]MDW8382264.1 2-C-methyl-D-erythritol 4-phosphate cytidylyltransferase [Verrucomicrobiota bacterium]
MNCAILVAAGRSTRMGEGIDKLWLELAGRPVLAHTWATWDKLPSVHQIILVTREETWSACEALARRCGFSKPFQLVAGGLRRQDSVWNGLQACSPAVEYVAVQDAARPCTHPALIQACFEAARRTGAAVAAQPMVDTIKESIDGRFVSRTLDRSRLWAVQTPQTFRTETLRRALAEVRRRNLEITDDTAACELIGQPVELVVHPAANPKLTRPEDLPYLEWLLQRSRTEPVGTQG